MVQLICVFVFALQVICFLMTAQIKFGTVMHLLKFVYHMFCRWWKSVWQSGQDLSSAGGKKSG